MLLKIKKIIQAMYMVEVWQNYMVKPAIVFDVDLGLKGHTYFSWRTIYGT